VLVLGACARRGTPLEEANITEVTLPSGKVILAETMIKDIDLARGMMFRDALGKDRGMILIHSAETPHPVFSYNLRIPLDLVWMDRNLRIVEIVANAQPCKSRSAKQCPLYGGTVRSRYVLELNAGQVAANQLKMGERLRF
jgi:hypothetical protein